MRLFKVFWVWSVCLCLFACATGEAPPLFMDNETHPHPKQEAVYVDIKGAVRNPGVYKLPTGGRLLHLVELSGGFTMDADTDGLGLSEPLVDGTVYHVPFLILEDLEDKRSEDEEKADEPAEHGLVSINFASSDTLATLPNIGPTTAQAIIDHRELHGPFQKIHELMEVRGIGEKTFEGLEHLITLQP